MAITRFTQNTPVQHTGQFFELPYEELAATIMQQDAAFKEKEQFLEDTYANFASQEYLPQDQQEATNRLNALMDQENKLRTGAGGNLLDPSYNNQLKDLFRREANSMFYKEALWNKKTFTEQYIPHVQKYTETYGAAPEPWQDPTGSFFQNYQGASKSGTTTFKPIEKELSFDALATTMLEPMVKNKLNNPDGKLSFSKAPDGSWIVKHTETGEVDAKALRRIMEGSELMTGEAYQQQIRKFQGTPGLQQAFGSFDNYMNSQLNAIANKLAHKYENETFKSQLRTDTPTGSKSKRKLEDMIGSSEITTGPRVEDVSMGVQPMFVPDVDKASEARTVYQERKNLVLNGGTFYARDYNGNIVEQEKESLQERLYKMAGIPMPTEDDQGKLVANEERVYFDVSEHPITGGIQATMKFFNPETGKMDEVDLVNSTEVHRKGDILGDIIKVDYAQFLTELGMINYEVVEANSYLEQEKAFTERAVKHAFGEYDDPKMTPYGRILQAYKEQYGEELYQREVALGPELRFLSAFQLDNLGKEAYNALATGKGIEGTDITSEALKKLIGLQGTVTPLEMQKVLGLNEEAFKTPVSGEPSMKAFVTNVLEGKVTLPSWLFGETGMTEEGRARIALQKFRDKGHKMAENYDKAWKDSYTVGLDLNMQSLALDGERSVDGSGTRVVPKTIYDLRVNLSTGAHSDKEWEAEYEKMINQVQLILDKGSANLGQSAGSLPIYNLRTNKDATDKLKDFREEGIELVGFTFDEGINLVITGKGADNNKELYEIRDRGEIVTMLADANFGPKPFLELIREGLVSFYPDDGGMGEFASDKMHEGQKLQSVVGHIGETLGRGYVAPLERYPNDTKDPDTGEVIKAGHIKYYNLRDQKYEYYDNMEKLVRKGYIPDLMYLENNSANLIGVTGFDFEGLNVQNLETFRRNGTHKITKEMINGVNKMREVAGSDQVPLFVTSMNRIKEHYLENDKKNIGRHTLGDALDFSIQNKNDKGQSTGGIN
jgi:hypothetical protein